MNRVSIPKLKNFKDFESFCIDYFNQKYKTSDFKKWGKEGQKQDGIDLFSNSKKILIEKFIEENLPLIADGDSVTDEFERGSPVVLDKKILS